MKDIAKKAGISVSTVSLAFSGHPRIPDSTKRRIQLIAEELGYESLSSCKYRSPTIGLLLSNLSSLAYLHEALTGLLQETTAANSSLQLIEFQGTLAESGEALLQLLHLRSIKGAVILGTEFPTVVFKHLCEKEFPFICIGKREVPGHDVSWVASDYINGAREGTQHLLSLGYSRIALATLSNFESLIFRERIFGYKLALSEAGVAEGPHWIINSPQQALETLTTFRKNDGVQAVFATSGKVAGWILHACNKLDIHVPQELAVLSFDDQPGADILHPPLTTVKQPLQEMGALAARTLLSWLRGVYSGPVQTRLQTKLIIRESCGALLPTRNTRKEV
jgi:LacI family transcriptional regulator